MQLHIRTEGQDLRTAELTDEVLVGRSSACDVVLSDERASRRHAIFRRGEDGRLSVEDLGSTNGTWIDGIRIARPTPIAAGAVVRIGRHVLTVAEGAPDASEPSPSDSTLLPPMPVDLPVRAPSASAPGPEDRAHPSAAAEAKAAQDVGPSSPPTPAAAPPPVQVTPPPAPPAATDATGELPAVGSAAAQQVKPGSGQDFASGQDPSETRSPEDTPRGKHLAKGGTIKEERQGAEAGDAGASDAKDGADGKGASGKAGPEGAQAPGGKDEVGGKESWAGGKATGDKAAERKSADKQGETADKQPAGWEPDEDFAGGRRRGLLSAGVGVLALVLVALIVLIITDPFGDSRGSTYSGPKAVWTGTVLPIKVETHGAEVASGSGFVVDAAKGLIVTTAHLIDAGSVYSAGFGGSAQQAKVVAVSPCDDLAVLKVADTAGLRAFTLGTQPSAAELASTSKADARSKDVAALTTNTVLGKVEERAARITASGSPSDVTYVNLPQYSNLIQTTAATGAYTSGGPLINLQGQVVGVLTGGSQTSTGAKAPSNGLAIGMSAAAPIIQALERGESYGYVGLNFAFPSTKSGYARYGLPFAKGSLVIPSAVGDSTAFQANFGHDVAEAITAVNGQAMNGTLAGYCSAVGSGTKGQSVIFTVIQPNKDQEKVSVPFE